MKKLIEIASTTLTNTVFAYDLSLTFPVDMNLLPANSSPHPLLHTVPVPYTRAYFQISPQGFNCTYIWPVI